MDDQISAPGSPIYNENDADGSHNTGKPTSEGVTYTPEISFKSELSQNPETQTNYETTAPPETITQLGEDIPKPQQEEPQPDIQTQKTISEPKIIDKSHEPIKIHEIKKPGDKLTEEADKEEERFIEEVEKHHGG